MEVFSHIDKTNNGSMVDISEKGESFREAHARGIVRLPEKVIKLFRDNEIQTKKGAVFNTAIIAGTMAVKKTSELIPFCHQLNIESCKIKIDLEETCAVINCIVTIQGKTGVEMEALTGVQIAALTIYDMCKSVSHKMTIEDVNLVSKTGGKSDLVQ